jgi:hypothetical protein
MDRRRLTAAAAAVLAAGAVLAGCGGSPPEVTGHGTLTVYSELLSGVSVAEAYPDVTTGSQVTVTSPSGAVIGTGMLTFDKARTAEFDIEAQIGAGKTGLTATEVAPYVAVYDFTVTVPGGESRYGIQAGKGRGIIWVSPSQMKNPSLTLGSLDGS